MTVGRGPWPRCCWSWLLAAGCAPQLDRIEVRSRRTTTRSPRCRPRTSGCCRRSQALAQLLRMERDAGDESSAMRLAKLSQVSDRLDQLLQKLDDNAEYMRDLSARVDLLATRPGIPTLGEYTPPPGGCRRPDSARGGPVHPRGGRAGSQPRQHGAGRGRASRSSWALRRQRGRGRRPLLAGRPGLRRGRAHGRRLGYFERAAGAVSRQRDCAPAPCTRPAEPAGAGTHGRGLDHGRRAAGRVTRIRPKPHCCAKRTSASRPPD